EILVEGDGSARIEDEAAGGVERISKTDAGSVSGDVQVAGEPRGLGRGEDQRGGFSRRAEDDRRVTRERFDVNGKGGDGFICPETDALAYRKKDAHRQGA